MSVELKIKSKHLSLEAQVIRFEENKLKRQIDWRKNRKDDSALRQARASLIHHRRWDVRNENRATFVARAYIEGRRYSTIEKNTDMHFFKEHILPRVVSMVLKYGLDKRQKTWTSARGWQFDKSVLDEFKEKVLCWTKV